MSTAVETTITNALLASGATTLAQFLMDYPGPAFSSVTLDYLRSDEQPRVLLHLCPSGRLSALADWAETVPESTVMVTQRPTYVVITIEIAVDDTPLIVWSHLARDEIAAVYSALLTSLEMDESAHLSPASLRQAASDPS